NGLLTNSENFQALNVMQEKYQEKVKGTYVDPPYNSNASKIAYKNDYEHSSWLSLLNDRINIGKNLISSNGLFQIAIDDIEFSKLELLVKDNFGIDNFIGNIAIMNNPKGRDASFVASSHEYTILAAKNINDVKVNRLELYEKDIEKKYPKKLDDGQLYRELPLRRSGSGAQREDRPYMYFPFIYKNQLLEVISEEEYKEIYKDKKFNDEFVKELENKYLQLGYEFILPIREDGSLGRWRWGYDTCVDGCKEGFLFKNGKTVYQIDIADPTYLPKSL